MSYLNAATYRERARVWRARAAAAAPGPEQDACLALAEGYAHLVATLHRLQTSATVQDIKSAYPDPQELFQPARIAPREACP